MSNYPPPPPGQPPYPPPVQPTSPMNPQQTNPHNPYGQQPPYPPPNQQPKKGGAMKWVLIGCAGFIIVGILAAGGIGWYVYNKAKQAGFDPELARKNPALAAAKVAINLDPDKELIRVDETNNTITVKDKKSGKVVTMTVEQDKNGHVVFKGKDENGKETTMDVGGSDGVVINTPDGNAKIGGSNTSLPDWVPQYPNAKIEGNFSTESDESIGKTYSFKTNDSMQQVISYFEDKLKGQGWKVSKSTSEVNGKSYVNLSSNDGNYKRFVVVGANEQDGGIYVTVTTQENKKKG